jgi:Arylsulfotransferase (ASST)
MTGSTSSPAASRPAARRWRRFAAAAAVLSGVLAAALATGATADAAATTTPTSPPPITILTQGANNSNGDIFIAPTGDQSTYGNGPEIIDNHGKVIWFHPVPAGLTASDFRTQTYDGQPVLTWWQGTGLGGLSSGTDYIYNDHYQQIATVNAGNGLSADGHEFLITPWNTALILAYTTATADLTSIGGPADQTVIDGVVQEVNIKTGQVLFQWNSADHVPYSASESPLPASPATPWDWFHINAVHLAWNGSLLIDARNTWATYDVSLPTGNVNWVLGGKDSTFTEQAAPGQSLDTAGAIFAWQHDPEQVGPDTFTWFDDEASPQELPYSRTVTVRLDFRDKTATLVSSDDQPEGLSAGAEGNAQTTRNGDQFVGWGVLPYFSEFSPSGQVLFNAEFPAGVNTYRAYRLPWPASGPGGPGRSGHTN